ncbi:MAG: ATP-dependent sacrificial sulfur transferase LarE [Candidatus Heimdallarchaeaceae archaeon]
MIQKRILELTKYFANKKVVIAFSGGLDSTVLLTLAKNSAKDVLAVTVKSSLVPEEDVSGAVKFLEDQNISHKILNLNPLNHPKVVENDPRRCYHCKKLIFLEIIKETKFFSPDIIVEGSNTSDLDDYRPGLEAVKELGIKSPFLELKYGKKEISEIASQLNLEVVKKPATTCLATRIPYGSKIEKETLIRIEKAEKFIKDLLRTQLLRVRTHSDIARIEVEKKTFERFLIEENREKIVKHLKELGYNYVSLDLTGYKQGSMNIFGSEEK